MVQDAMPLDVPLPDDLAVCQRMLRDLLATLHKRDHENAALKHQIEQLLRRIYGPRSERHQEGPSLFDSCPPPPEPPAAEPPPPEPQASTKKRGKPHGRRPLPKDLPRHTCEHQPGEAERLCPCCGKERVRLGEQTSEQLEYVPASLRVIVNVRPTLACLECLRRKETASPTTVVGEGQPMTAWLPSESSLTVDLTNLFEAKLIYTVPMPKQPIAKGLAGPGLLAYIASSKFVDHLPLYRQEKILARQGVDISRSTMSGWLAECAELCVPLYERMKQRVLKSRVIHNDDTPIPVQAPKTGKTKTGRFWASIGDASNPYNVFNYTEDRSRDGPDQFFEGYQGWLQVDAYSGYEGLFAANKKIREVACWAHARRNFFEAQTTDAARALTMLAFIKGLYEVEDEVKNIADDNAKAAYRRRHARPQLIKIKKWLREHRDQVLPKSPIAKAIGYALNNWRALNRYVLAGYLSIDNNPAERSLRGIAIGRKNYLFLGSDAAGKTASVLYSLVSSAQRHGIDPWAYLRDVFTRLPELPPEQLGELLPDNWAAAQQAKTEAPTTS